MLKFFGLVGLVGAVITVYMVTYGVGPERQLPPSVSLLEGFREEGFVPQSLNLAIDESAEEAGVFEVPEQDEVVLEAAIEAMGDMDMGGMDMGGMDMSNAAEGTEMAEGMDMSGTDSTEMAAADATEMAEGMDMSGTDSTEMAAADATEMAEGMDMSGADSTEMAAAEGTEMAEGMDMSGADSTEMAAAEGTEMAEGMDMSGADSTEMAAAEGTEMAEGMDMSGADSTEMAQGMDMSGATMAPDSSSMMGEGGLLITEEGGFDREIALTMTEWGFSDMQIDVKMGERIKFTVNNGGQIPHEFMFMDGPLMAAANYRGTRADWNLLEHEALFEQALVLPGGEFEFVLQVQQAGSWMFMCMLPYHMQMGMMGQMATEGMAMDMDMAM